MPPKILVISGPTASGKTRLAVELACATAARWSPPTPCRSTAGWTSALPSPPRRRCGHPPPHAGRADPEEDFSVARYVELAAPAWTTSWHGASSHRGRRDGSYLDSLLSGRTFAPFSPTAVSAPGWRPALTPWGGHAGELAAADPEAAARLHPNDRKRIVRALEVFQQTGKTISQHNWETGPSAPVRCPHPLPGLSAPGGTCGRASTGGWTR